MCQPHDVCHIPHASCNSRFHRGRDCESLVNPAEVQGRGTACATLWAIVLDRRRAFVIAYVVGLGSAGGTVIAQSCPVTVRQWSIFLVWVLSCQNNKSPRHPAGAGPWLPLPTRRERRKGEQRQGAGGLETLFRGVKTRYVVENAERGSGRAK